MCARRSRNGQGVPEFLQKILDVANYKVTEYGTINPFRMAAAHHEKKDRERVQQLRNRSAGTQTLEGSISAGHSTPYAIDGHDIHIGSDTMVVGDISIGAFVRVKLANGGRAKTIVVTNSPFSS